MKAICFSDTHFTPVPFTLPEADFGIFAGDCSLPGKEAEIRDFVKWFSNQPVRHKIFVPGNHDRFTEKQEEQTKGVMSANGITYLNNSGVEIEGVRIYGSAAQPFFCDWAWNVESQASRAAIFAQIPNNLDILVTHCPPFGILDGIPRVMFDTEFLECVGCKALLEAVKRAQPRFHVFGHIHESRGVSKSFGTTFINASICDCKYKMTGSTIEIDLEVPDFDINHNV